MSYEEEEAVTPDAESSDLDEVAAESGASDSLENEELSDEEFYLRLLEELVETHQIIEEKDQIIEERDRVIAELNERAEHLLEDVDNIRRRAQAEAERLKTEAGEKAAEELLPIIDNLQLALGNAPDESSPLVKGVTMVLEKVEAVVRGLGVTAIDAEGQPFDPELHEAVNSQDSDQVTVETVGEVFQRGYRIGEARVIRPARVLVMQPTAPASHVVD